MYVGTNFSCRRENPVKNFPLEPMYIQEKLMPCQSWRLSLFLPSVKFLPCPLLKSYPFPRRAQSEKDSLYFCSIFLYLPTYSAG
jgi:hypothetical protein